MSAPDMITTQVIGNALLGIAEEMGVALRRSAYSTNIKERSDCSTAVFDHAGRLIAQAEHMPIHMGSMAGLIAHLLDADLDLADGDVFITNDPYAGGGTHLPDITVAAPVFRDGELAGFVADIAHHSDVGGRVPGSNSGDCGSIYEEGLRIPLVRLVTAGRLSTDVLAFVTLNSRLPEERGGDIRAQLAACHIGRTRLLELHERYGADTLREATGALLDHASRRLRAAVAAVPDGEYAFTDHLDPDEPGGAPVPVSATVTVAGERIAVDFTGTGPQSALGINVVRSALEATVCYAVKAVLDPEIPANGGFFDGIAIAAPEGCLVNPRPPAPVAGRTDCCQRVADAVLGALAKALPERVPAGSHSSVTYFTLAGEQGGDFWVYPEVVAGGMGARPDRDGLDAVQVHITNSSNLPIEALELEYPLRVNAYELITDSGGAGRFRGGLGIRREIQALDSGAEFSSHADRQQVPPWGLCGGLPGSPGGFVVHVRDGEGERLSSGRASGIHLEPGEAVRIEAPGSGGHGNPLERDPGAVAADVADGRVSPAAALDQYGVVLTAASLVDDAGTAAERTRRNATT